jgi:hypothetical protein
VKVFNVSEYRRSICAGIKDAEWFDNNNIEARTLRDQCNGQALEDMLTFLRENKTGVAILDSTNPTHERRLKLVNAMRPVGAKVMFIEVLNDNEHFLTEQYLHTANTSPDYTNMNTDAAVLDYRSRVEKYAMFFEPLDKGSSSPIESKWSYFKCDHYNHHFVVHNVRGYLPLKVVNFIMNLRTTTHAFYLSRHGQSEYNLIGTIAIIIIIIIIIISIIITIIIIIIILIIIIIVIITNTIIILRTNWW